MNYSEGFSASYHAYEVDPITWRDGARFGITGGSINKDGSGLRDSADIDTARRRQESEGYIRVYLDARQGGSSSHEPLFTGLATSPERDIDGVLETNTLECYSVLKAADDMLLPIGYFAPAGVAGTRIIQDLLSVIPAPVTADEDAPSLQSHIVAEDGETRLTMADRVLTAIGWHMTINGYGEIHLSPYSMTEDVVFDPQQNDVLEPTIKVKYDWYEAPNVFRAVMDEMVAIARDDSEDSPLSTVNRGREIWAEDTSADLNTGESLAEFAERRLRELQQTAFSAEYDRRYDPNVNVGSVVRLNYPVQGLDGLYRVISQKIELGHGAKTSEEVERI